MRLLECIAGQRDDVEPGLRLAPLARQLLALAPEQRRQEVLVVAIAAVEMELAIVRIAQPAASTPPRPPRRERVACAESRACVTNPQQAQRRKAPAALVAPVGPTCTNPAPGVNGTRPGSFG